MAGAVDYPPGTEDFPRGTPPRPGPASAPELRDGIGVCLSGGGYRAMLFHIGLLKRLNDAGVLKGVQRFSSVSGGSITSGLLGLRWKDLTFGADDVATNFDQLVT